MLRKTPKKTLPRARHDVDNGKYKYGGGKYYRYAQIVKPIVEKCILAFLSLWILKTIVVWLFVPVQEDFRIRGPIQIYPPVPKKSEFDFIELDVPYLPAGKAEPVHAFLESGEKVHMSKNNVRIGVPETLAPALLEYAKETGVYDMLASFVHGKPTRRTEIALYQMKGVNGKETSLWAEHEPDTPRFHSDMHFMSHADEETYQDFLRVLGDGGFDQVLQAIADCYPQIEELAVLEITFGAMSWCTHSFFHSDTHREEGLIYNILFPVQIVEGSPPEMLVANEDQTRFGAYNFEPNVALGVGDRARHSTGPVDYSVSGNFRLNLSVVVADVRKENLAAVARTYTGYYPPVQDPSEAVRFTWERRGAHFRRSDPTVKLPRNVKE